jgi:branched-chain amino acid transport system ATP-binding protein
VSAIVREETPVALSLRELDVRLGGTHALQEVSADFPEGAISGVIGPNGAGKSTLLNCICGLVPVTSGDVYLFGDRITGARAHEMTSRGIGRTFQGAPFVHELSVLENVMIGGHTELRVSFVGAIVRSPWSVRRERELRARAIDALGRVGLESVADRRISELPFGDQKRIDIARGLLGNAPCLLLDEPMAGLSLEEKDRLAEVITALQDDGDRTIILVEHDMRLVNQLCSYVIVLDAGRKIAAGDPATALAEPEVVTAFLGTTEVPSDIENEAEEL